MQPSVATDSQHEGDKEAGKEATAEPTETVSRELQVQVVFVIVVK